MNVLKGKAQLAGKPASQFPWRAPPPNIYCIKNLLGFINHDITKKLAPAYSLVRYVYPPKPKVKVSTAPFIKAMRRKQRKKTNTLIHRSSRRRKKKKKKKQKQSQGRARFKRREDMSNKELAENVEEEEPPSLEVFDTVPAFKPPPLKYKLTRRTSSVSDLFMMTTGNVKCKSCNVWTTEEDPDDPWNDPKYKNDEIHGIQYVGVAIKDEKHKTSKTKKRKSVSSKKKD
ncbi:uncharacterized protein LOC106666044 [Cimex lectularius]|uniref:Uncharacterized protein n=1 Tax=Cimex lectularius TaxID=79782 RepID=A0A8I6RL27_CIMLE|nr:uncharacterized protein LOC106666044 [Cimex lectularius]